MVGNVEIHHGLLHETLKTVVGKVKKYEMKNALSLFVKVISTVVSKTAESPAVYWESMSQSIVT